jgi:hypothetical protein
LADSKSIYKHINLIDDKLKISWLEKWDVSF